MTKDEELLNAVGLGNLRYMSDRNDVAMILKQLRGAKTMEAGTFIGGASIKDAALLNATYQRLLIQQNMVIIRQLDRLTAMLYQKEQQPK